MMNQFVCKKCMTVQYGEETECDCVPETEEKEAIERPKECRPLIHPLLLEIHSER